MNNRKIRKQNGAILVFVGLALAVLLGFGGLVIDLGGLFVAKSELQSAVDSCALAAAQELNGAADSTIRATNAGKTAGNFNKVNYQESSAGIVGSEVQFSDSLVGTYSVGVIGNTSAKYARCKHRTPGISAYLIQLVGGSSSNPVEALAVATLAPSQTTCSLPLGLLPRPGGTSANNYGYQIGEWVNMVYGSSPSPGEMGWFNLDGSTNANETEDEIKFGYCKSGINQQVGTPGVQASVADAWNARFGIYKNSPSNPWTVPGMAPDYTGYAYTSTNWTNAVPQNAYNGTPAAGSDSTAANYKTKSTSPNYANYANTGASVNDGDTITGLNMKGGFQTLATAGVGGQHNLPGYNKRVISLPVLNQSGTNYTIKDYACMLMLQPLTCNNSGKACNPVQLEYRGLASNPLSGCATNGLGGGSAGALVPVLVQ